MKIQYKQGNLFAEKHEYIAHGCNAQGVMGSGIAKQVKALMPEAYTAYLQHKVKHGLFLGDLIPVICAGGTIVFNCITQQFYGGDGKRYASYSAIEHSMRQIGYYMEKNRPAISTRPNVAMPKIGCGLGGLDWSEVSKIIESNSWNFNPIVYDYKR